MPEKLTPLQRQQITECLSSQVETWDIATLIEACRDAIVDDLWKLSDRELQQELLNYCLDSDDYSLASALGIVDSEK